MKMINMTDFDIMTVTILFLIIVGTLGLFADLLIDGYLNEPVPILSAIVGFTIFFIAFLKPAFFTDKYTNKKGSSNETS